MMLLSAGSGEGMEECLEIFGFFLESDLEVRIRIGLTTDSYTGYP